MTTSNLPPVPDPTWRRGEHGAPTDMYTAEQLHAYATVTVTGAHPDGPAPVLGELPTPTWFRGMYGSPFDVYSAESLRTYALEALTAASS